MKAEYYKWYSKDNDVRPINGETIIVAVWYDCWRYDFGYYVEKIDKIHFTSCDLTLPFTDVYKWMMIEEPIFEV